MINVITVTNYRGESKRIELADPEQSGFVIERIEGLGPVKAMVNLTEAGVIDGAFYNSARASYRNIVISLSFLPMPEIEDTRRETYKYFPLKKPLTLRIETDKRNCRTIGYVESNEPDIFSSREGAQISILCPGSYFYADGDAGTSIIPFTDESAFEFPFSNESLTSKQIEFRTLQNGAHKNVRYYGDVETGVVIRIFATGEASGISFYNAETYERLQIDTQKLASMMSGVGIQSGDELIISTLAGAKTATLLRDGKSHNILNCLYKEESIVDPDTLQETIRRSEPDWFRVEKGGNEFAFEVQEGLSNLQIQMEIPTLYEGV